MWNLCRIATDLTDLQEQPLEAVNGQSLVFSLQDMEEFLDAIRRGFPTNLSEGAAKIARDLQVLPAHSVDIAKPIRANVFGDFLPLVWRNKTLKQAFLEMPIPVIVQCLVNFLTKPNQNKAIVLDVISKLARPVAPKKPPNIRPLACLFPIIKLQDLCVEGNEFVEFMETMKEENINAESNADAVIPLVEEAAEVDRLDRQILETKSEIENLEEVRAKALSLLQEKIQKIRDVV